jgi:cyclopropane-fatty-acyl-phospholipid synthase
MMGAIDAIARRQLLARWNEALQDTQLIIREGSETHTVGGRGGGEAVTMTVYRPRFYARTLSLGSLGLGEAYMDKDYEVEGGLHHLYMALARNRLGYKSRFDPIFALKYLLILTHNKLKGSAVAVRRHYDLGLDLYESFLDPSMSYTSGYATSNDDDLETLQATKFDRICRKLDLKPGETLLDLGCGFGSTLIYAAKHHGIRGIGISLSPTHADAARHYIAKEGLSDRIAIHTGDFRSLSGSYDKVSTIGMIEHVLPGDYDEMFHTIARYLRPGGLAIVNGIGNSGAKNRHDPFIQKYIFPATNQPLLSQIARGCERAGLAILDVENYIRSYFLTAYYWHRNFEANRHKLDPKIYDERFVRMWQVYFAWGLAASRYSDSSHYEVLVTNDMMRDHPPGRV